MKQRPKEEAYKAIKKKSIAKAKDKQAQIERRRWRAKHVQRYLSAKVIAKLQAGYKERMASEVKKRLEPFGR